MLRELSDIAARHCRFVVAGRLDGARALFSPRQFQCKHSQGVLCMLSGESVCIGAKCAGGAERAVHGVAAIFVPCGRFLHSAAPTDATVAHARAHAAKSRAVMHVAYVFLNFISIVQRKDD